MPLTATRLSYQAGGFFGAPIILAAGLLVGTAICSSRLSSLLYPSRRSQSDPVDDFDRWLDNESWRALEHLLAAFGPDGRNAPGVSAGAMIASPSRPASYLDRKTENANYFFHWTRDTNLERIIQDSILFNTKLQQVVNLSGGPLDGGLGEPKFLIDGSRFDEPWSRPQNDGPAIRATSVIRYAQHLLNERPNPDGALGYIHSYLYQKDNPNSLIRLDIDHVCRTWNQPSSDLWEEVDADHGGHFYTLLVQRKSISDFLHFARSLPIEKQPAAEDYELYESTLLRMDERLEMFWNPDGLPDREGDPNEIPNNSFVPFVDKPHILPTLDRLRGQPKPSQVDTAVLLAINHTAGPNQAAKWLPNSDRALATLDRLVEVFEKLYPINRSKDGAGIAIGRYPEDEYDGVKSNSTGHPWFLCTHAVAESTYSAINLFRNSLSIQVTRFNLAFLSRFLPELAESFEREPLTINRGTDQFSTLLSRMSKWADRFLMDVSFKYYDQPTGRMSEQIDRKTGQMRGARELTWSYASLLTALDARKGKLPC